MDDIGKVVREVKVASEPDALLRVLRNPAYQADRTGSRTAVAMAIQHSCRGWFARDLRRDAAHAGDAEGANQQDGPQRRSRHRANDAGWTLPPGACETKRSQKLQMLLTHRKLLQAKAIAIENDLRGTLRNFRLKVGMVGKVEVRGPDQGVGREPVRFGNIGGTDALNNPYSPDAPFGGLASAGWRLSDQRERLPAHLKCCFSQCPVSFFLRHLQDRFRRGGREVTQAEITTL